MFEATSLSLGGDSIQQIGEFDFAQKSYGKAGREVPVYANYVPITCNARTIYHYNIDIQVHDFISEKEDKNVPQRNRLLQQKRLFKGANFSVFERLYKQETSIFSSEPVYDGVKNIYSKTKLNIDDRAEFQVKQKVAEKKFPVTFDVIITTPKDSHVLDMSILNNKNSKRTEKEVQALDVILQYGPKTRKVAVGRNFFIKHDDYLTMRPEEKKRMRSDLGQLKELAFGHFQSAKLTDAGIQLNIDRASVVFNKGGKLIDLIEELATEMRGDSFRRPNDPPPRRVVVDSRFKLNSNELNILNNDLKGLNFIVDHLSFQPMNKVFGLTDKSVSQIFFEQTKRDSKETTKVSVKEYFEKIYKDYLEKAGLDGLLPNLPCVQVGKTNPKFYPIEVVKILPDQYYAKPLKPKLQGLMTRVYGQQQPSERFKNCSDQVKTLIESKADQTNYLKYFDIHLDSKFSQARGRLLNPASLLAGDQKMITVKDAQWRSEKFVIPSTNVGSDYMVVNFTQIFGDSVRSAPNRNQVDDFVKALCNSARNAGVNLQKPVDIAYTESYRGKRDLEDAFADYIHDFKNLKLIIYIIPTSMDDLYNNIKFLSETKFGVVTQCVSQGKSKQFASPQYVSNLMLKINAKLGGTNFHLHQNCKIGHLKKKTMIMGLDTTHPSKKDRMANSVACVVASYDSKMINYVAKCVVQPKPRKEVVLLDKICYEMLQNFNDQNKFYPDQILMYRDGVSDGQFNEVVECEINLMKKAFASISPTYCPKITFIVVQKRHHARFLPVRESDRIQKSQNLLPGTVIDNNITSNYLYDFYISSHFGALGTTRPTRFIILHDESGLTADEIQGATNLLSYTFPRCTKAVSIPSPVLYAHLAAKRARSYLFILDNNKDKFYGEEELSPQEIEDMNKKIEVKTNLKKILYYV